MIADVRVYLAPPAQAQPTRHAREGLELVGLVAGASAAGEALRKV